MIPDEKARRPRTGKKAGGGEDGAVKEMKKKWARGKKVMP